MGKRGWINLGLLLVVTLLGLAILFSPARQEKQALVPLTPLQPQQVNSIRIRNPNGPAFTLERGGDEWRMTAPYRVVANTPRIKLLLDITTTPSVERFPIPAGRLDAFGLEPPKARMALNETNLLFGGTHPYNHRRYIRTGDTLHLINDHFPHHFMARAEDFVSHNLFTREQKLSAIETPDWQLHRVDDRWQLSPENSTVSMDKLVKKAQEWKHAQAARVMKAPLETSDELIRVQVPGQTTRITFEVVRLNRQLLLVRRDLGIAYRLPADTTLLQTPNN